MDFWDEVESAGIVELEDGRTVLFPYGVLGKGKIVTHLHLARVRKLLVSFAAVAGSALVGAALISLWLALATLPLSILWMVRSMNKILADCETLEGRKYSALDRLRKTAEATGVWKLARLALASAAIILLCLWIATKPDQENELRAVAGIGIALFGLGFVMCVAQLVLLMARRRR